MPNVSRWKDQCSVWIGDSLFRFHINERDGTINFEEFLSYFPDNEVRHLSSPIDNF